MGSGQAQIHGDRYAILRYLATYESGPQFHSTSFLKDAANIFEQMPGPVSDVSRESVEEWQEVNGDREDNVLNTYHPLRPHPISLEEDSHVCV